MNRPPLGFYYASRRSDRAFLDEHSQSPSVMERNLLWWEWAVMNDGWEGERREEKSKREGEHLGGMNRKRLNWLRSAEEGQGRGHTRQKKEEEVLSLKLKLPSLVSKDNELFPSSISLSVSLSHTASLLPQLFSFHLFLFLFLTSLAPIKSSFLFPRTGSSHWSVRMSGELYCRATIY